jgi:uncharacterized membrane protein SirB2
MLPVEVYPALKLAHVSLVSCSGVLFTARGAAVLAGGSWPMRRRWRTLSYFIDTLLLAAGGTLWLMLRLNPAHDTWLGAKLFILLLYIVAGTVALKRGRTPVVRWASYGCAISLYLFIASIAVTHNPIGILGR